MFVASAITASLPNEDRAHSTYDDGQLADLRSAVTKLYVWGVTEITYLIKLKPQGGSIQALLLRGDFLKVCWFL